jgi:valyl-tRNA synthetase
MMMFGLFAMDGVVPFRVIALHGLVRDKFGKKMSKSRGNAIDPLEFMDRYGTDAVRFTLARGSNPGADQALAEEWVAGSRNFATKLWNATRFAMMNGATVSGELPAFDSLNAIDRWILSRLNKTVLEADGFFERYEFARACELIYHFAWDDLCDWYLELSKEAFASGAAQDSKRVLGFVLDQLLRLMHPVMPFITEELWTSFTGGESLVVENWPEAISNHHDAEGEKLVLEVQRIITEVRRFKNDQGVKASQRIPGRFLASPEIAPYESAMRFVLRIDQPEPNFVPSASVEIGKVRVELDLSGTVDVLAERMRLRKDLATAQKDRESAQVKLDNDNFIAKAPAQVVVEIKERLIKTDEDIQRIFAQLEKLPTA